MLKLDGSEGKALSPPLLPGTPPALQVSVPILGGGSTQGFLTAFATGGKPLRWSVP